MRKITLVIFMTLMASGAFGLQTSLDAQDRTADEQPAVFELHIENNDSSTVTVDPSVDGISSRLFTGLKEIQLAPGESKTQSFNIYRANHLQQGNYQFEIFFEAKDRSYSLVDYFSVDYDRDILVEKAEIDQNSLESGENLTGELRLRNTLQSSSEDIELRVEGPANSKKFSSSGISTWKTRWSHQGRVRYSLH